jgi:N-acetylglucosamine-6-phosphate deacetylase
VIRYLSQNGCRVQIGHSLANGSETAKGFQNGLSGFTHMFNAMTGFEHRNPGTVAYALAHGVHAEIICDLIHVNEMVLKAAYRAIPELYAITDASVAAGRPDGEFDFGGGQMVVKNGMTVMLTDGSSLAGSAITMLDAFRNLVQIGLTVPEASEMCATRQANYIGRDDLGVLAAGRLASFVVLDRDLALQSVWISGKKLG